MVLDDGIFLACESSLKHKAVMRANLSSAVAGGEGLFNLSLNAYSVGIAMPPSWAEEYGLCCIPIPGFTMEFGCIRRAGEPVSPPEQMFMEFLKKELDFLDKKE